jgi:hypothetical protein
MEVRMIGNRIRMDKPGASTPVPVGTWGVCLNFSSENGWEIEWENGVTTFFPGNGDEVSSEAPEGEHKCDFCSSTDARWEHRAHDASSMLVAVGTGRDMAVGQSSHGSWAACDVCHRLIEAKKPDRLAYRCARQMAQQHPGVPPDAMLFGVKQAHRMYWDNAVGPGFPIHQPAVQR